MTRMFHLKPIWALVVYALLDIVCTGMGMGVPFFCILLGFPVGWYIARFVTRESAGLRSILSRSLRCALFCSLITFALMSVIWGRMIPMMFDPGADLANFGVPMILYEPRASFIGWAVLMIVISPFLQLLATVFGSCVTLARWKRDAE